jgi:hypothetical protein
MNNMKNRVLLFLIAGFIATGSYSQEIVYPPLKKFKVRTDYPVFVRETLWDFINGAADNYLSYGFEDLNVAEYKKGKNTIKLEIYRHNNSTNAFGIYSSERSPSFRFVNLGAQGYIADGVINFFKGNYYVKIKTYSKKTKILQAEEMLASRISEMLTGSNSMPALLTEFPAEGMKHNEETYINESVLGHSFLTKAFKVPYEAGNDIFTIYVMENSTPEETKKVAETYIASTGITPSESGDNKFVLTDGYNGTIFLSWKGNRIVIISGLAKDQSAMADKYSSAILK